MATTITVSYSELDTARQCLKKHEFGYKQRWTAPSTGPALARGILWHTLLEGHYKTIARAQRYPSSPPMAETELKASLWWSAKQVLGQAGEHAETLEWMYTGYLEAYGLDPQWEIVAVEHAPSVWLPTERGGRSRFKIKLKIDLLVRQQGRLWVVDHKSGRDLPNDKELALDDQFSLYTWAMRQLGFRVFGQLYNAARTLKYKDETKPQPIEERFRRKMLSRTDIELHSVAIDAYRQARQAYSYKIGLAPRSPNPDTCRWRCDYTEACLLGRKGMDTDEILRSTGYIQDFTRH